MVGRDGYWPIAVLNERTTHDLTKRFSRSADDPNPLLQAPPSTMVNLIANYGPCDVTNRPPRAMNFWTQSLSELPSAVDNLRVLFFPPASLSVSRRHLWATPSSDGLFSVFRRTAVSSQAVLLGLNCALAVMPLLATLSAAPIPSHWEEFTKNNASLDAYILLAFLCVLLTVVALYRNYPRKALVSFLLSLAGLALVVARITTSGADSANESRSSIALDT